MTDEVFRRGRDEVEYVDECPQEGCEAAFVGMTPDDVRDHIEDDHGDPLGRITVFPDDGGDP